MTQICVYVGLAMLSTNSENLDSKKSINLSIVHLPRNKTYAVIDNEALKQNMEFLIDSEVILDAFGAL